MKKNYKLSTAVFADASKRDTDGQLGIVAGLVVDELKKMKCSIRYHGYLTRVNILYEAHLRLQFWQHKKQLMKLKSFRMHTQKSYKLMSVYI